MAKSRSWSCSYRRDRNLCRIYSTTLKKIKKTPIYTPFFLCISETCKIGIFVIFITITSKFCRFSSFLFRNLKHFLQQGLSNATGYVCLPVCCSLYLPLFPQAFKLWCEFEPNLSAKKRSKNSELLVKNNENMYLDRHLNNSTGRKVGMKVKDLTLRKAPFSVSPLSHIRILMPESMFLSPGRQHLVSSE